MGKTYAQPARRDRTRAPLEPDRPLTVAYNGPIDILQDGRVCLQIVRIEDLPRNHRLRPFINPKSDTRYYAIDDKKIKGLHFNKEVSILGLSITRKGDKITLVNRGGASRTEADFVPAETRTEPEARLALQEFQDLEARLRSAGADPDALPPIIAIQMELREKYEGLLEQPEIASVLDRIQGLILAASSGASDEPPPLPAGKAKTRTVARETTRRRRPPSAIPEILSWLHKAAALETAGDTAQGRKALDEADRLYAAGIDTDTDDRARKRKELSDALEADDEIVRWLREKDGPLVKLASDRLQEAEARKQEPLARKELGGIRDGFIELLGRKLGGKKDVARATSDYQALRKREKELYVEMLIKPDGKFRSVNIWQDEYPEGYRKKMQGLSTLRDEVLINKVKARNKLTSGGTRDT
jgi:hypothetical protein